VERSSTQEKFLVIYVSLAGCQACCVAEAILKSLVKSGQIPPANIVSIDYKTNRWILDFLKLDRFPNIIFNRLDPERFFLFNGIFAEHNVQAWLANLRNPSIKIFNSESELIDFYITGDQNPADRILVLGIFYDESEYEEDIQRFKQAYHSTLVNFPEIQFGLLTSKKIIQSLYKNDLFKKKFFGDNYYSVIAIKRGGNYEFLD
jgi:hypothetical protein